MAALSAPKLATQLPSPAAGNVIARAQRGDRSAQATLLNDLQDVLFRFCVSMLGDQEAARDATQETALRFLQYLPSYRGESGLKTWALGIALNVCRETRRTRPGLPLQEEQDVPGSEVSPERAAEVGEDQQRIGELLTTLSDRQREAIVLRFFEGLSVEAVGKAMGCAAGTVKATIHQALHALRTRWKDQR